MKNLLPAAFVAACLLAPAALADHSEDQQYNPGAVPIDIAGIDLGGSFFKFGDTENTADVSIQDASGLPVTIIACQNLNNNAECEERDGDLAVVGCGFLTIEGLDPTLIDETPGHEGGDPSAQLIVKPDFFGNFFEEGGCGTVGVPTSGSLHVDFYTT